MRAWCTEHMRGNKKHLFSMTIEGMDIGIRYDSNNGKVFISPMWSDEWLVIRNAINEYLKKEGLE